MLSLLHLCFLVPRCISSVTPQRWAFHGRRRSFFFIEWTENPMVCTHLGIVLSENTSSSDNCSRWVTHVTTSPRVITFSPFFFAFALINIRSSSWKALSSIDKGCAYVLPRPSVPWGMPFIFIFKPVAQRHQMVSGSLALLFFYLGMRFTWFLEGKQGSGPNRGQSPVEWGDFPSHVFICPSVCFPLWAIHPGLRPSLPGRQPEAWKLAGPQA